MIPLTIRKNRDLLQEAGFRNVVTFSQSLNFVPTVIIK